MKMQPCFAKLLLAFEVKEKRFCLSSSASRVSPSCRTLQDTEPSLAARRVQPQHRCRSKMVTFGVSCPQVFAATAPSKCSFAVAAMLHHLSFYKSVAVYPKPGANPFATTFTSTKAHLWEVTHGIISVLFLLQTQQSHLKAVLPKPVWERVCGSPTANDFSHAHDAQRAAPAEGAEMPR